MAHDWRRRAATIEGPSDSSIMIEGGVDVSSVSVGTLLYSELLALPANLLLAPERGGRSALIISMTIPVDLRASTCFNMAERVTGCR